MRRGGELGDPVRRHQRPRKYGSAAARAPERSPKAGLRRGGALDAASARPDSGPKTRRNLFAAMAAYRNVALDFAALRHAAARRPRRRPSSAADDANRRLHRVASCLRRRSYLGAPRSRSTTALHDLCRTYPGPASAPPPADSASGSSSLKRRPKLAAPRARDSRVLFPGGRSDMARLAAPAIRTATATIQEAGQSVLAARSSGS